MGRARNASSVKMGIPKLWETPEGWNLRTFGEITSEVQKDRKAILDDQTTYSLVTVKRNRGGVVHRSNLMGKEVLTKTQFYVRNNDFLISRRQIIHGACGVVPIELDGSIVSNEYNIFEPAEDMDLYYLESLTHTEYFQMVCFQSSVGVDIEKMVFDLPRWQSYKIPLPPLPEQQRIATILNTWDEAIETLTNLIALKEQRKRGLMQQLLTGAVRFPGFGTSEYKDTKLGSLPTDWDFQQLSNIGKVITGQTPSTSDPSLWGGDIPLVTPVDITSHPFNFDTQRTISEKGLILLNSRKLPAKTIVYSCIGSIGKIGMIHKTSISNQQINAVLVNDKTDPVFVFYALIYITPHIQNLVSKTAVPIINKSEFSLVKIPIPPLAEQQKIAQVLSLADQEIDQLNKQLEALKEQKRGLMQKLLTGQVRVNVA